MLRGYGIANYINLSFPSKTPIRRGVLHTPFYKIIYVVLRYFCRISVGQKNVAHPTELSAGWSQNSRVLIRTLDGVFNPIPYVLIRACKSRPASLFFAIKTREF